MPRKCLFLMIVLCIPQLSFSYNLQRLSSKEGLSNSSILSICQDKDQFMWFGSADGLNMYDGINIQIYKPTAGLQYSLSGNMIEGIIETEPGIFWVRTNQGFNKLNKNTRQIEYHNEFSGSYLFAKTTANQVFAIRKNNQIEYYDEDLHSFVSLAYPGIRTTEIMNFFIDSNYELWMFHYNGKVRRATITFDQKWPVFTELDDFKHTPLIMYCYNDNDRIFFIDNVYDTFELDARTKKKNLICNLKEEIGRRGQVSRIIRDNDDYLVAFQTNGLIRLKNTPDKESKYIIENIDLNCGVLSLLKDNVQDIIWIGTDGQGVYMHSRNSYSMRSVGFNDIPVDVENPVRALFCDTNDCLWIGTRGGGIVKIRNYEFGKKITQAEVQLLTVDNSELTNNSTYTFLQGRRDVLWIGGDGPGLNYYSFADEKIHLLKSEVSDKIRHVHAICETNDSTLWVATGGNGFYRLTLAWKNGRPVVKQIWNQHFNDTDGLNNHFFSICQENDSILWFGNRGSGAIRLNTLTNSFKLVNFPLEGTNAINDVLSIHKDGKGMVWFGSSFGLTKLLSYTSDSVRFLNYNEQNGLPNNTIHSITEDSEGRLWLSTNQGIVEFDSQKNSFRTYNYQTGLKVVEFSDGAFLNDKRNNSIFFGGIDGFVTIRQDIYKEKEYVPKIFFTGIKIYESEFNLRDLTREGEHGSFLQLRHDQNFFSVSFVALDYINGQNYKYLYNLEGFNEKWIDNGYSNLVTFTNISPGEYTLHVRTQSVLGSFSGDIYSLRIVILPPWYMMAWAYLSYALIAILLSFYVVRMALRRYRKRRTSLLEKLNQQQREEIYESKLRFFTNITHEFCTPLTLIHGPCNRLVSYKGSDDYVKKYAALIMRNSERLNALIQELIEFRRIETGHKKREVERFDISVFSLSIAESFNEIAETRNINYIIDIEEGIDWNTDKNGFSKIILNLLSNAFKYTEENGSVSFRLYRKEENLHLNISNTGKGIREEDIPFVFDRYSVLENFEKQTGQGIASRNGLGLAICDSMVSLLEGTIEVHSSINCLTEFKVTLPVLAVNKESQYSSTPDIESPPVLDIKSDKVMSFTVEEDYQFLRSRPTIMIIDDDPEMLWFVSEIFTERYNIIPIEDSRTVFGILEQTQPSVIISDIMMPDLNGIELTRMLKSNRRVTHIPLILLSAKNSSEEQVEGIKAGAEVYLTKPFNVDYLKSIVDRLIARQDDLKEYYTSALSAFEFKEGQFVHKEDKQFLDKALKVIEREITNPQLNAKLLATELGLSARHLSRKLTMIIDKKPSEFIREYKLILVEKLLVSSKLTIEEIMDKTGFVNRGSFYRIFSEKFQMTPKQYRREKKEKIQDVGK